MLCYVLNEHVSNIKINANFTYLTYDSKNECKSRLWLEFQIGLYFFLFVFSFISELAYNEFKVMPENIFQNTTKLTSMYVINIEYNVFSEQYEFDINVFYEINIEYM